MSDMARVYSRFAYQTSQQILVEKAETAGQTLAETNIDETVANSYHGYHFLDFRSPIIDLSL